MNGMSQESLAANQSGRYQESIVASTQVGEHVPSLSLSISYGYCRTWSQG